MTTQERMYRATRLLMYRAVGEMPPAEAWRLVNPNSKSNDNSAAELTRRELQWYERNKDSLSQRFGRFADVPVVTGAPSRREAKTVVRPRR